MSALEPRWARLGALAALAAVAALTLTVLLAFSAPAPAAVTGDRLPDLGLARLTQFTVQRPLNGRRLLRFTTVIVNVGRGPFEVRGARPSVSLPNMTTVQRIYSEYGGYRDVPSAATMFYSGDGHNHFHVRDLQLFELIPLNGSTALRRGAKTGFCFYDNTKHRLTLAGAPQVPVYPTWACGVSTSTKVNMGLSTGWGDAYTYNLGYQYIDVTGVPSGRYRLRVTADPNNEFLESDDTNNATWVDIQLSWTSLRPVYVLAYGPSL